MEFCSYELVHHGDNYQRNFYIQGILFMHEGLPLKFYSLCIISSYNRYVM